MVNLTEHRVCNETQGDTIPAPKPDAARRVVYTYFHTQFLLLCKFLGISGFVKNVVILVGGTVLGQILTIIGTPIIAHLYTPHDLGLASVYGSMLSFIMIIGCWCYELAIPLPKDDETAALLTIISGSVALFMACCTGIVMYFFGDEFCQLMKVPDLRGYLFLLPVSLCAVCFYQILSYWVVRWQTYGILARTKISQSVGQITVQIGAGVLSEGAIGLLVGDVIGRSSGVLVLARQLWRTGAPLFGRVTARGIADAAYRYRRFPMISSWSGLLNGLGLMYPLVVTYFYGTQVVGWLALSQTIIGSPLGLLSVSVGKVYYGEAAKLTKVDAVNQMLLFRRTIIKLVVIIVPIVVIAILVAPYVIPKLFGTQWTPIILYMQILMPSFIFTAISGPMFYVLDVFERQDMHLVRESMRIPMMLGPFIVGGLTGCSALTSIVMYSVSASIFYLVNVVLAWHIIKQS